jgi:hypothetical protein
VRLSSHERFSYGDCQRIGYPQSMAWTDQFWKPILRPSGLGETMSS